MCDSNRAHFETEFLRRRRRRVRSSRWIQLDLLHFPTPPILIAALRPSFSFRDDYMNTKLFTSWLSEPSGLLSLENWKVVTAGALVCAGISFVAAATRKPPKER